MRCSGAGVELSAARQALSPMHRSIRLLRWLLAALFLAAALAGCATLDEKQRQWIFQPSAGQPARLPSNTEGLQDVWIEHRSAESGRAIRLHALWMPQERADAHPYGPEWAQGFAHATLEAALDITMYAATATVPPIDRARLRAARTAARHLSPLNGIFAQKPVDAPRPTHREW